MCCQNPDISFLDERPGEMMGLKTYCLFGCKAMTYLSKPFEDMLISRKRDGQDIRDGIIHFHKQKSNPPTAPRPRPPNITAEKHLNSRFHKYLRLTTFQPIDRAYEEREKEESLRERAQRVMKVQDHRNEARGRREGFMGAQRRAALQRQKWEQDKLETTLKLQTAKQEQEVQLVRQKNRRFLVEKQMNMMEQEAVKRFSRRHGALSKAFSKHYIEHKLGKTLHERRWQIATQNASLQTVQRHLENRYSNLHTCRTIKVSYIPGEH